MIGITMSDVAGKNGTRGFNNFTFEVLCPFFSHLTSA